MVGKRRTVSNNIIDDQDTKILGPDWKRDHGEGRAQSSSESKDQAADQAGNDLDRQSFDFAYRSVIVALHLVPAGRVLLKLNDFGDTARAARGKSDARPLRLSVAAEAFSIAVTRSRSVRATEPGMCGSMDGR
jgi:hypothetical protein